MSSSKKLREILEKKSILKIGGAFDALSAKLVEVTGYDAIWAGSFLFQQHMHYQMQVF